MHRFDVCVWFHEGEFLRSLLYFFVMNEWEFREDKWTKDVHTQLDCFRLTVKLEGRVHKWSVFSEEMGDIIFRGEEEMIELAFLKARIYAFNATLSDEDW